MAETLVETPMRIYSYCLNRADNEQELEALRRSVHRGRPYGTPDWQRRIAKSLGLESAYRSPGRPRIARRRQQVPEP